MQASHVPPVMILTISLALAGAAQAQAVTPAPDIMSAHLAQPSTSARLTAPAPGRGLDLSSLHSGFNVTYAHAGPARIPGIARTSVDQSLVPDEVTGSLGFLCGLEPGAGKQGAAAARGYDPSGRFLGAKLRFAFR